MRKSSRVFKVGTRGSSLALTQTDFVLERLTELVNGEGQNAFRFEKILFSSPGDRDRGLDLTKSPEDFFTRDLDEAVLRRDIDLAVHSAKDMSENPGEGIDWVWLPWREDRRDVLVCRRGETPESLPPGARVGVSSERRIAYCRRAFPRFEPVSIRGNVEERVARLDEGRFDMIILAAAGLSRLGLGDRITRFIPLEDLEPPEAQGVLAVTFRKGDPELSEIRKFFVTSLVFAGAGISVGDLSLDVREALISCEVCFHDALLDSRVLRFLSPEAKAVSVGKRSGDHSVPQGEINQLLLLHVRRGKRVLRLKGGDPGIFGRLAEEVEALESFGLPYRVLPGTSSFQAAAAQAGMILTKRGVSRGFTVMTPRREGGGLADVGKEERARLPLVLYMGTEKVEEITRTLIGEGRSPEEPAAALFGIGSGEPFFLRTTLGGLAGELRRFRERSAAEGSPEPPGLIVVGEPAALAWKEGGLLGGKRILLTSGFALQDKAAGAVLDFGGHPLAFPLIDLVPEREAPWVDGLDSRDWVVLTSPSAARFFLDALRAHRYDLRRVPRIIVPGRETARELERAGLYPDIVPEGEFSAESMLKAALGMPEGPRSFAGARVLRLKSDRADDFVAASLRKAGALVEDVVLYRNVPRDGGKLPAFEAVFFASSSAAEVFIDRWGRSALEGREVLAIGGPTEKTLRDAGVERVLLSPVATVRGAINFLAEAELRNRLRRLLQNGLHKTE